MLLSVYANATKKRVNNNKGVNANYSTFVAAYNAASSGDTLYLEGSLTAYTPPDSIKKRLVVIGPGYFLENNDSTQANLAPASFSPQVAFGKGSENSVFMGVTFSSDLFVNASNITIARNYIAGTLYLGYLTQTTLTGIIIKQNFLAGAIYNYANYAASINTLISNNIIFNTVLNNTNSNYVVKNNIFTYLYNTLGIFNATLYNNIVTGYYTFPVGQNNNISYNMFLAAGTNANGNQYSINMANVFVQTGSSDGYYKLKPGSLAIGAGAGGVDCGVFGNNDPYILSGLPPVPHIFNVNIQGDGSNSGLPVVVKAKSQK